MNGELAALAALALFILAGTAFLFTLLRKELKVKANQVDPAVGRERNGLLIQFSHEDGRRVRFGVEVFSEEEVEVVMSSLFALTDNCTFEHAELSVHRALDSYRSDPERYKAYQRLAEVVK